MKKVFRQRTIEMAVYQQQQPNDGNHGQNVNEHAANKSDEKSTNTANNLRTKLEMEIGEDDIESSVATQSHKILTTEPSFNKYQSTPL